MNVATVVECVRRHGPIARVDVSRRTGLGRSTVTQLVSFLIDEGLLVEAGTDVSSGGRRPVLLELVPSARYAVGVKLAPEVVTAAVVDLSARVVGRSERPVTRSLPARKVLTAVVDAVRSALDDVSASFDQVIGIGVALPGIVDPERGTSISPTFFGWSNLAVRDELEAVLDVPVVVENDANAFALAEYVHGAGRGFSHMFAVTIGVGVGAGLITNGWIYRGGVAGAGELGHITISQSGPVCVCGNRGCLESRVSDEAIAAAAASKWGVETTTRAQVVAAALEGDAAAIGVLRQAGRHFGTGLASALNLLNPERIVVGGEAVEQAGELLLEPARASLRRHAFSVLADDVEVVAAELAGDAWVVGAATLILEEFFRSPVAQPAADAGGGGAVVDRVYAAVR